MSIIYINTSIFQVIFPVIYRILCEMTFNLGINSHIIDATCVILSVTLLYGKFIDIKRNVGR